MLHYISIEHSKELCQTYHNKIRYFVANNLIFLDKSIFNEKTGWRHQAYTSIDSKTRYEADLRRRRTWSIYATISLNNWLPYTEIQEDYYKLTADFGAADFDTAGFIAGFAADFAAGFAAGVEDFAGLIDFATVMDLPGFLALVGWLARGARTVDRRVSTTVMPVSLYKLPN
jgi:hypothetical protein